jgi:large subunit ribosomal protein L1
MPTPKTGTVSPDVGKAVREFKAGKVDYRNDSFGNVHAGVGRLSFSAEDLSANIHAMLDHLQAVRPAAVKGIYIQKVYVSSTMGPGVRLAL